MRRMYSKPQLLEAVEQEAKTNGIKVFEDIKDKDGHNRFIEGDVNLLDTAPESIEKLYGKWSLSGTHLMIVFMCKIDNGATISRQPIITLDIPKWIKDKIIPSGASSYIEIKTTTAYSTDWTSNQSARFDLMKFNDYLQIIMASINASADRYARVQFDLLIDNE